MDQKDRPHTWARMESETTSRGSKRPRDDHKEGNLLTRLPDDVHRIISTFYSDFHDPPLVQVSEDNKIRIRVEQTKDGLVRYCTHSLPRALINQRTDHFQFVSPKASFGNKWVEFGDCTRTVLGGNLSFCTSPFQVWTEHLDWFRKCEELQADIARLNSMIEVRESDKAIRFLSLTKWIKPLPLFPKGGTMILE